MLAEIITIGDEILIGQTVDTNSAWLGKELNIRGIDVERISSIRDTSDAIINALNEAKGRADIILLTGGLGPTNDDITKITLAKYFNTELVLNEDALENIKSIFSRYDRPLLQVNIDQAKVPSNCLCLKNPKGTAPGMYFNEEGVIIVSMPGVPYEMKAIMTHEVLPRLEKLAQDLTIVHETITVVNIPESLLSEQIRDIESALPDHIKLAYLPHLNLVRLRLTGRTPSIGKESLEQEIHQHLDKIKHRIGNVWFHGDKSLSEIIGELLIKEESTLGTIESCTGGYIAHSITITPGSSAYFYGGVLTYSNQFKIDMIGVDEKLFTTVGSVSEEVAHQMAQKGKNVLGVDYCISATGIAGPSGATEEKPVGLVYIGLALPDGRVKVKKNHFSGNRAQVIEKTAYTAMEMLRSELVINQNAQIPERQQ